MELVDYKTPQDYLNASEDFLKEREIENNLILGLCNGFPDRTKMYKGCIFLNAIDEGKIKATSIKTVSKAIVSCVSDDLHSVQQLACYYKENQIDLTGVVGKPFYSSAFAEHYGKSAINQRTMIVHQLEKAENLTLASGKMELATAKDADLLVNWTLKFEDETHTFPAQSREKILWGTQNRIQAGNFFIWVDKNSIVSMAAIVRKTENIGIVGLVYTPETMRGNGYGASLVLRLSEEILKQGKRYCGLFTDKSNPTSNYIYKKIGYEPVTEFTDIEFG